MALNGFYHRDHRPFQKFQNTRIHNNLYFESKVFHTLTMSWWYCRYMTVSPNSTPKKNDGPCIDVVSVGNGEHRATHKVGRRHDWHTRMGIRVCPENRVRVFEPGCECGAIIGQLGDCWLYCFDGIVTMKIGSTVSIYNTVVSFWNQWWKRYWCHPRLIISPITRRYHSGNCAVWYHHTFLLHNNIF